MRFSSLDLELVSELFLGRSALSHLDPKEGGAVLSSHLEPREGGAARRDGPTSSHLDLRGGALELLQINPMGNALITRQEVLNTYIVGNTPVLLLVL